MPRLYKTMPGGGGASGAMVRLAQIVTSGSQATVDFTSISAAYTNLKVIYTASDTQAGSSVTVLRLKVNNDGTAGNYTSGFRTATANGGADDGSIAASALGMPIGILTQATLSAFNAYGEIIIPNYTGTTFNKNVLNVNAEMGTATPRVGTWGAAWKSTAAVNRLTFGTDGTAFLNGSVFSLYGIL